jgi:Tfp pilus assembly protein PilF
MHPHAGRRFRISRDPDSAASHLILATDLARAGETATAMAEFERARRQSATQGR